MHTVFALLCFVVVIHWLIFPYPSGLLHWYCGNLTIAPVPAKQPWWIWINTSCEFIMNDCITTTKQSTTKPCAYFLGYTVPELLMTYQRTYSIYNRSVTPCYRYMESFKIDNQWLSLQWLSETTIDSLSDNETKFLFLKSALGMPINLQLNAMLMGMLKKNWALHVC